MAEIIILLVFVYLIPLIVLYWQKKRQVHKTDLIEKKGLLTKSFFNKSTASQIIELESDNVKFIIQLKLDYYIQEEKCDWNKHIGDNIIIKYKTQDEFKNRINAQEILTSRGKHILSFDVINRDRREVYNKSLGGMFFIFIISIITILVLLINNHFYH
jgi:hypothetical protein